MAELAPHINVILNALSLVFLCLAFLCIKEKKVKAHVFFIGLTLATAILFLISYINYHFQVGHVASHAIGLKKFIYWGVLTVHLILCGLLVPLVIFTLMAASRKNWEQHRRRAPYTFVVWTLTSLTGILIYFMVYW